MSISNPSWHLLAASKKRNTKIKKGQPHQFATFTTFRLRIHNCTEMKPCIVPRKKLAEGTCVTRSVSDLPWIWPWFKVRSLAVALWISPVKDHLAAFCQCLTRQPNQTWALQHSSKHNRDKRKVCACKHLNQHNYNKTAQIPARALVCARYPECQPCGGKHKSSPGLGPCHGGRSSEQRSS